MPALSLKKIIIAIVIIIILSNWNSIKNIAGRVISWFTESLQPINDSNANSKCMIAISILFLLLFIAMKLIFNRKRK